MRIRLSAKYGWRQPTRCSAKRFMRHRSAKRNSVLWGSHEGGFVGALVWLWWSLGVALVEPWGGFGGALRWLWGSLGVALVWLCTPESMPSICLVYGSGVALGGFLPQVSGTFRY